MVLISLSKNTSIHANMGIGRALVKLTQINLLCHGGLPRLRLAY